MDDWRVQLPVALFALSAAGLFATLNVTWLACAFSFLAGVGTMFSLILWRDQ